jgi:uncharacterized membrane protein YeaQ/YmgE (transglycosylase-associated protein family)
MLEFMWFLAVGAITGYLAGMLPQRKGFGRPAEMFFGVVGAMFGGYLLPLAAGTRSGLGGSVVLAFLGALVAISLAGMARRSNRLD